MVRVVMVVVVVSAAALVAFVIERRRPDPPTQGGWAVPSQVDRADFAGPDVPWLVAVFTSASCLSCAEAVSKAMAVSSEAVAVVDVEVGARPDLHRRYDIEAVPTTVVADPEGVVRASYLGPPPAAELWAVVAEVRR